MSHYLIYMGLLMAAHFLCLSDVNAATILAESCSQTDVQAAINSASSGDVVLIPSGTATWTTSVSIPDNKKITLMGGGYDNTVIKSNVTAVEMNHSGSRLTELGFEIPSTTSEIILVIAKGIGWRVDHCKFTNKTEARSAGVVASGMNSLVSPRGVVDHCIFYYCKTGTLGMGNFNTQSAEWAAPLGLGTDDAMYIEDCIFYYDGRGNCVDTNRGGKYVFRYNTVYDADIMAHSLQAANERASRKWEIYNNTIIGNGLRWDWFFIRGGTGVAFNNTVKGSWGIMTTPGVNSLPYLVLDNRRSGDNVTFKASDNMTTAGLCDGDNVNDGNEPGQGGYPCRDQIGRSTDQSLWTSGAPYPPQELNPAYFWNNKYESGDELGVYIHTNNSAGHIQENRDYYLGVAKPDYTPYTYPHPLVSGEQEKPGAPTNLRAAQP